MVFMQVLAPAGPPQYRPRVPSQPGSVVPPQATPTRVPAVSQVPRVIVLALSPTQERPRSQGRSALQAPFDERGAWHSVVAAMQRSPLAQVESEQSAPMA